MLQQRLTDLKNFILKYNTYFDTGCDNAVMNEAGIINDGNEAIFPADDKGAYFYMRLPNSLVPDYSPIYIIADNAMSIGVKYDVILVACVPCADNSLLLENMITTLGRYQQETLKFTKMINQSEIILLQELVKIGKENIESALERIPEDLGMCSVHFSFTIPFVFQNLNCIQKPCKDC